MAVVTGKFIFYFGSEINMNNNKDKPFGAGHFFDSENQVFINKLNKICKTYDDCEKDVSTILFVLTVFR
jgi:hypothetical protein